MARQKALKARENHKACKGNAVRRQQGFAWGQWLRSHLYNMCEQKASHAHPASRPMIDMIDELEGRLLFSAESLVAPFFIEPSVDPALTPVIEQVVISRPAVEAEATSSLPDDILPAAHTVLEDTALIFSEVTGNPIVLQDAQPSSPLTITLSTQHGFLTLATTTGLVFSQGSDGTSSMVFVGSVDHVNAALNGLTLTPNTHFNGPSEIVLQVQDAQLSALQTETTLQGRYAFNDSSVPGFDSSPLSGNPATTAVTVAVDNQRGTVGALTDGDHLSVNGVFGQPPSVTVAAWINMTDTGNRGSEIISLGDNVVLRYSDFEGGRLRGAYFDGSGWQDIYYVTPLVNNGWQHVAYTIDSQTGIHRLYLDNALVAENPMPSALVYSFAANTTLGKHARNNPDWNFIGQMDDAQIYTRALLDTEITTLFNDNKLDRAHQIDVTIIAVNDAPDPGALLQLAPVDEDAVRLITGNELLTNASDIEGDALSVTDVVMASGSGSVQAHNGQWLYTSAADDDSDVQLQFTVSDGTDTATGLATLDILPVNDAPVVTLLTLAAINEDSDAVLITQADLLQTATDIDSGTLTAQQLMASSGILIDHQDGSWTLTPAPDDDTAITLTFTVSDGNETVAATASLDILPVNDAPVVGPISLPAIDEDTAVVITESQLLALTNDIDNTSLSVTAMVITAGGGTLAHSNHSNGDWTYTPEANDDSQVVFEFTVTDGVNTVIGVATLDILPVNDAPMASTVLLPILSEDPGPILITQGMLLANAQDADGQSMTASNLSTFGNGSLVDHLDGTFTYTPADNYAGLIGFIYDITDGIATIQGAAIQNLLAVNDAPIVTPVTLTPISEDSGAQLISQADLLTGASDIENQPLTASALIISQGNGTLIDHQDGTFTYTPGLNDSSDVTFDYLISDGISHVTNTAYLDIIPVNGALISPAVVLPAILEDSGPVMITEAQLLQNAVDQDGDPLTAFDVSMFFNTGATVTDTGNGTWSIDIDPNHTGFVVIVYKITDGSLTIPAYAVFNVDPVNDAPIVAPLTLPAINEDSAVLITQADLLQTATDVDSASLRVENLTANSGLLVDNLDGSWTLTPAPDDDTDMTLTFTVSDGIDPVAVSTTLDILPVNDAPVASVITLPAVNEDTPVLITESMLLATATDLEGDTLTVVDMLLTSGSGELIPHVNNTWSYTPGLNDDSEATFLVTISDGTDTVSTQALLNILPINDAPIVAPLTLPAINEDSGSVIITQADLLQTTTDVDSQVLQAQSLSVSSGTLVDNLNGSWTLTPALNDDTTITLSFTVTDGIESVAISTILDILPVNDAPTSNSFLAPAIDEDSGPFVITRAAILANAVDPDSATLQVSDLTAVFGQVESLIPTADGWEIQPVKDDDRFIIFSYVLSDGSLSTLAYMGIFINPVNDAPVIPDISMGFINEDSSVVITQQQLLLSASDIEGDALAVSALTLTSGSGVLVDNLDGSWRYTPAADVNGNALFQVTVTDGTDTSSASVLLDIIPINDAPTTEIVVLPDAPEDSESILITQAQLLQSAQDKDGDVLTALNLSTTTGVLMTNPDGSWTYTPAADNNGLITFTYGITDGTIIVQGSARQQITPVNDEPVVTTLTLTPTEEDTAVIIAEQVLLAAASDIDEDTLFVTAVILSQGQGNLQNAQNGNWLYTPAPDDDSNVQLQFTVSDGTDTVTGLATLDILPVNDAPVISILTLPAINEDSDAVLITQADLLQTATDIDSSTLTAQQLMASSGVLIDHQDGSWTLTPAPDDDTAITLTFTVSDGNETVAATASLDILPVNDAPIVGPIILPAINEDSAVVIRESQLLASATDIEGDGLFVTEVVISQGQGGLQNTQNGSWLYTSTPDDDSDVQLRFTVSDGMDTTQSAATLDLLSINDASIIQAPSKIQGGIDPTESIVLDQDRAIVIIDIDDQDTLVQVVLTATDGTLQLGDIDSVSDPVIVEASDQRMVLQGKMSRVNALLAGLTYHLNAQFTAHAITINLTEIGANLQTSQHIHITSTPLPIPDDQAPPAPEDDDTVAIPDRSDSHPVDDAGPGVIFLIDAIITDTGTSSNGPPPSSTPDETLAADAISNETDTDKIQLATQMARETKTIERTTDEIVVKHVKVDQTQIIDRSLALNLDVVTGTSLNKQTLDAIDQMLTDIDEAFDKEMQEEQLMAGIFKGFSYSFALGYVAWVFRSGALLATSLANIPLWRNFDPIALYDVRKETEDVKRFKREKAIEDDLQQSVGDVLDEAIKAKNKVKMDV